MNNVREMDDGAIRQEETRLIQELVALSPYRGIGYPDVDDAYRKMRQRRSDLRDEFVVRLKLRKKQ